MQRILLELLNQMDGFDQQTNVKPLFPEVVHGGMLGFPTGCETLRACTALDCRAPLALAEALVGALTDVLGACPYLGRAAALATASAVILSTRRTVAAGVRM